MVDEIEVEKTVIRKFTCYFPARASSTSTSSRTIRLVVETTNDRVSNLHIYNAYDGTTTLMEFALEYPDIFNKLVDTIRRELAPEIAERALEEATKGGK